MANYTEEIKYGDVMTIQEFVEDVEGGMFIDYDGFGHPVKDGLQDPDITIYPSQVQPATIGLVFGDATHVCWYNR
jgi:hypothetical protein